MSGITLHHCIILVSKPKYPDLDPIQFEPIGRRRCHQRTWQSLRHSLGQRRKWRHSNNHYTHFRLRNNPDQIETGSNRIPAFARCFCHIKSGSELACQDICGYPDLCCQPEAENSIPYSVCLWARCWSYPGLFNLKCRVVPPKVFGGSKCYPK